MKEKVKLALITKANTLIEQGYTDLKTYEVAFQDVLEQLYPQKCWWQVTKCQIFEELMAAKNVFAVIGKIVDNLVTFYVIYGVTIQGDKKFWAHTPYGWADSLKEAHLYTSKDFLGDDDAYEEWNRIIHNKNGEKGQHKFARILVPNYDIALRGNAE